jgi:hypothetical protein
LNKRRAGKLVRHGGLEREEASARAVNAQPWDPPPGMVKRQCSWCRYYFAAPPDAAEPLCPDCVAFGSRPASADPT